jgi:cell division transport system ATP-binding protein
VIRYAAVSKNFGNRRVLDQISLEINPGECVAFTGESGAGKSTMIYLLLGAIKPDSGRVEIDGYKIASLATTDLQVFRRSIGVIFQDFKLLKSKTVQENVSFALEVIDEDSETVRINTKRVLSRVGLWDKRNQFPGELSGGEMQRVAIARALAHEPKLIIADEPTGNLDQRNALEVLNLLKEINAEGVTIVIATHNQEVLEILSPRIINIDNQGHLGQNQKPPAFTAHNQKIDLNSGL